MNRYNWVESEEGHLDIITDIRFKPSSHVFATSSFDRTVQIWDPNNVSYLLPSHSDIFLTSVLEILGNCDTQTSISDQSLDLTNLSFPYPLNG